MKKKYILGASIALTFLSSGAEANAWNNLYIFGDSLSDSGNNGRYTNDGATNLLYGDYIAKRFGLTLKPSNDGGTNYAQGGATATAADNATYNSAAQLQDFLSTHNNTADSNALYIYWIGGNDMSAALTASSTSAAEAVVSTSATAAASQIGELIQAGARTVIAPTVPNTGYTPTIMETVLQTALGKYGLSDSTISSVMASVHNTVDNLTTTDAASRLAAIQKGYEQAVSVLINGNATQTAALTKTLMSAYETLAASAQSATQSYNSIEDAELAKLGPHIVRADIYGLLNEIIADPSKYGIANTAGYACPEGSEANKCYSSASGYNSSKTFLFSNNFHPTAYVHEIMAQYMLSILNAPRQATTLIRVNSVGVQNLQASLDSRIQLLRMEGIRTQRFGVFGGYSSYNAWHLGGDYQVRPDLYIGFAYNNYAQKLSPASSYSFNGSANVYSLYSLWKYHQHGWISGDVHLSDTNYNNVQRSISLGSATRNEVGSTQGTVWGGRLTAGWNFDLGHGIYSSPILQYAWDISRVNAYREDGSDSTAMHFGKQFYNSQIGTAGWRIDTRLGRFNPYVRAQVHHQFGSGYYSIDSAINSTATLFNTQVAYKSPFWFDSTAGFNAILIPQRLLAYGAATYASTSSMQIHSWYFGGGLSAGF